MSFPIFHNFGGLADLGVISVANDANSETSTNNTTHTVSSVTTTYAQTFCLVHMITTNANTPAITSVVADPGGSADSFTQITGAIDDGGTATRDAGVWIYALDRALSSEDVTVTYTNGHTSTHVHIISAENISNNMAAVQSPTNSSSSATSLSLTAPSSNRLIIGVASGGSAAGHTLTSSSFDNTITSGQIGKCAYSAYYSIDYSGGALSWSYSPSDADGIAIAAATFY